MTSAGRSLVNEADLRSMITELDLKRFVAKHIGGGSGDSVRIIEDVDRRSDWSLQLIDGKTIGLDELVAESK